MQFCPVEIKKIKISGDNPRIINKKSQAFLDLIESIRAIGVMVPVHVREIDGGKFELLAGERRLLAAREVGYETISVLNHGRLSDDAAFDVTFAENYARVDLTILEQGRAVATLLTKYKNDVTAVASKMGKNEQWVHQREAINNNLSDKWKELILEDSDFSYFTAAHLGLIARFPQHIQDKDIYRSLQYCSDLTVRDLEKRLAEQLMILKKAPFDTAGCQDCQKRSSCQPTLWAERAEDAIGTKDRCLDKKCWQSKEIAVGKAKFAEMQKKHPGLVCVEISQCYEREECDRLKKIYGRRLSSWQFSKVKKATKGAVPALVVHGSGKGRIIYVKVKKEHNQKTESNKPETLKQLRAELEERRWAQTIMELYKGLEETPATAIKHKNKLYAVALLIVSLEIDFTGDCKDPFEFVDKAQKQFSKNPAKACEDLASILWETMRINFYYLMDTGGTAESIKTARMIAGFFGIDIDEKYREVCEREEFKEPAEWANLKADGTPKTAKSKKGKKQVRKCRVCGCTEEKACQTAGGPCHWVEEDLCSACADKPGKPAKKGTKAKKSKK